MIDDDVVADIFYREIVRELINQVKGDTSDETVERVWSMCNGNPWCAGPLYLLMMSTDPK